MSWPTVVDFREIERMARPDAVVYVRTPDGRLYVVERLVCEMDVPGSWNDVRRKRGEDTRRIVLVCTALAPERT